MAYQKHYLIPDCIGMAIEWGIRNPINHRKLMQRASYKPKFITGEQLVRMRICRDIVASGAWGAYNNVLDAIYINPTIPTREHKLCTIFHELVHSTMHPKRLNRFRLESFDKTSMYGATEEVTAILGSIMLASAAQIQYDGYREWGLIEEYLKPFYQEQCESIMFAALDDARKAVDYLVRVGGC